MLVLPVPGGDFLVKDPHTNRVGRFLPSEKGIVFASEQNEEEWLRQGGGNRAEEKDFEENPFPAQPVSQSLATVDGLQASVRTNLWRERRQHGWGN
jgi:hypothetical protein